MLRWFSVRILSRPWPLLCINSIVECQNCRSQTPLWWLCLMSEGLWNLLINHLIVVLINIWCRKHLNDLRWLQNGWHYLVLIVCAISSTRCNDKVYWFIHSRASRINFFGFLYNYDLLIGWLWARIAFFFVWCLIWNLFKSSYIIAFTIFFVFFTYTISIFSFNDVKFRWLLLGTFTRALLLFFTYILRWVHHWFVV